MLSSARPWDPERHARRLVPAGTFLVSAGLYVGGWGFLAVPFGFVLLLTAAYSPRDGLLLLGPFARYELARTARKKRPHLWRVIYALAVAALLFGNFLIAAPELVWQGQLPRGRHRNLVPYANLLFFLWYTICLIPYVTLLAVTQFSSLVAEERAGKRWEVLLTTDLRPREILFGKAAGRVPQLLDPVLTSIPVLVIATLFGGVSPTMVVLVSVAALALAFGIGGVAAFYSVFQPTPTAAATSVVGMGMLYLAVSGIMAAVAGVPAAATMPSSGGTPWPVTVADGLDLVAAGNPIAGPLLEVKQKSPRESTEAAVARATRKFCAFHFGVGLMFGFMAGARLRTAEPWGPKKGITLQRDVGERPIPPDRVGVSGRRKRHVSTVPNRPPVFDQPLAWWEWFGGMTVGQVDSVRWLTNRKNVLNISLIVLLILVAIRLPIWLLTWFGPKKFDPSPIENPVTGVILFAVWVVTLPMFLGPAGRAAKTIARERAADTLEALRTLPLDPREVIYQKWLGCVQSAIPYAVFGLCLVVPAVLTGFVSGLSLVGLVIVMPVYVMALAGYGLTFGVRAKTPARASFAMVVTTVGLAVTGFIVLGLCAGSPGSSGSATGPFLLAQFPPIAVAALLAGPVSGASVSNGVWFVIGLVFSLCLFAAVGYVCYSSAVQQFEAEVAMAKGRVTPPGK